MEDVARIAVIVLPAIGFLWLLFLISALARPQRLFNSFLLLLAIGATLFGLALLFGDYTSVALLVVSGLICLGLLAVPALLIANGVKTLKRESRSLANLLSLLLGIFVGVGEVAFGYIFFHYVYGKGLARMPWLAWWIGLSVFYVSALILTFVLYNVVMQVLPRRRRFDFIIIHGCGLIGGERVSPLLQARIDKAITLFQRSKGRAWLIPSGGQGDDEHLSEAEAMERYLVSKGIPEEKIIPEAKSKTTRENLIFSKAIVDKIPGKKRIALVTSNYHVYRCLLLAKDLGIRCTGVGARVAGYYWVSAIIREFVAVFSRKKYLILTAVGYVLLVLVPVWFFAH